MAHWKLMPHTPYTRKRTKQTRKLISTALTGNRNATMSNPEKRRRTICASVAPETHDAIRAYASENEISVGKAIDAIVALTIRRNTKENDKK